MFFKKVYNLDESMKCVDARVRDICEFQVDPNYIFDKFAELEDRSRRNNLRIDRITMRKAKHGRYVKQRLKIFLRRN